MSSPHSLLSVMSWRYAHEKTISSFLKCLWNVSSSMLRAISCFFCRSLAEFCKEFQRSGFDAAAPERNNLFLFLFFLSSPTPPSLLPRWNWVNIFGASVRRKEFGDILLTEELILFICEGTRNLPNWNSTHLVRSKTWDLCVLCIYLFLYFFKLYWPHYLEIS